MVCSTCNQTNKVDCDNTPPATNVKCIVFTLFVVTVYWFLPKNKWILLLLMYLPYLMMAHYDYIYDCKRNFGPTILQNYYQWAKPKDSRQNKIYENWCPKWKRLVLIVDIIIGILFMLFMKFFFITWNPKV